MPSSANFPGTIFLGTGIFFYLRNVVFRLLTNVACMCFGTIKQIWVEEIARPIHCIEGVQKIKALACNIFDS